MPATLYERLGGYQGIAAIVSDMVDLHLANPAIQSRFAKSDPAALKEKAALFFCAGSGGSEQYPGKNMLDAHRGMNISEQEFMAVLDDALTALQKHGVGQQEQMEVLYILHSMRKEVVRV
jgi:hemoglobin